MGYPNRNEKTDRAGNPPMTLAQIMNSAMGGGSGSRLPRNTYYPSSGMGYNNETGAYEQQMPGNAYASVPAPNAALDAINSNVGKPPVSLTVSGGNHAYNNPAWGAGSIFNPAWGPNASLGVNGGKSLPPLPNAVSATMQRNGGLSLPFFTPKTEQAPQAKPDLATLLGALFKYTPQPKQLPMPAALPKTYGGTAEAFRGAQARDRLTMSRNGAFSPGYSGKQDGERWGQ